MTAETKRNETKWNDQNKLKMWSKLINHKYHEYENAFIFTKSLKFAQMSNMFLCSERNGDICFKV